MSELKNYHHILLKILKEKIDIVYPEIVSIFQIVGNLPANFFGKKQIEQWRSLEGFNFILKDWKLKIMEFKNVTKTKTEI